MHCACKPYDFAVESAIEIPSFGVIPEINNTGIVWEAVCVHRGGARYVVEHFQCCGCILILATCLKTLFGVRVAGGLIYVLERCCLGESDQRGSQMEQCIGNKHQPASPNFSNLTDLSSILGKSRLTL